LAGPSTNFSKCSVRDVKAYIEEHSRASFSHGVCPECSESLDRALNLGARNPIDYRCDMWLTHEVFIVADLRTQGKRIPIGRKDSPRPLAVDT
jgi:hypothetical protein